MASINLGGKKRGNSVIGGLIFGVILFFGSFVLLWWNEGDAVAQFKAIGALNKNTVEVTAESVDPQQDGLPVYVSANANTTEELRDDVFDIGSVALKLTRKAEMYQWEEDERTDSDTDKKTYSYSKTWSSRHIDSSGFHDKSYKNPPNKPYNDKSETAKNASLGAARKLPPFLINDLNNFTKLSAADSNPDIAGIKHHDGGFYIGADPSSPEIGDMRIRFSVIEPGVVSLIAEQTGPSFKSWTAPNERKIHEISPGVHSKADLIKELQTKARIKLWILRGVGFGMMYFGILCLLSPLSKLAGFIPFLGDRLQSGVAAIGFFIAAILSLMTIMVAWIAHRPLVGISILVVIAGLIFLLVRAVKSGSETRTAVAGGGPDLPPPPPAPTNDEPPPPPPA
ncbi:MAG: TMEM43 family protein [Verrucomicrobiota bacterium]